jgi:type IV pilus assembly protein PilV
MPVQAARFPNPCKGFSLLEVMIAGVVTSSGLAGLAALLIASVSGTAQSGYRSVAVLLANDIAAQLEAAPSGENSLVVSPVETVESCSALQACTPEEFIQRGLQAWAWDVNRQLPDGSALVCRDSTPHDGSASQPGCDGAGRISIKVFWRSGSQIIPQAPSRHVKVLR